ncbi:Chemotaxis protein CheW [Andreprevotia sp. IGB-42]|uniref:chemotaxis protein CheW n=1 Tax=Andreprevotia sp. IGB-42 TaxID=2497473 RepID=UPI00135CA449|nr:chemotaxis protein CheW [Andreprevotia sp. IGB-42]KAF0813436.1 Chemotaxis protein CheW [Andreprevotia sp. IGB-42]
MTSYKGIEIDASLRPLIRHMGSVNEYREMLQRLQAVWDNLALLGQLSGMATDMVGTRQAFAELTTVLLNKLGLEMRRKLVQELGSRAQVAVDILTRNLFERTADIGFLAIDDALRQFAAGAGGAVDPDADDGLAVRRAAIVARFRAYVEKYSVYDDIVLLTPDGRVLARLDARVSVGQTHDPVVAEALSTRAAYVEHFGVSDLFPQRGAVLRYAYRISDEKSQRPLGVLCLSFRFDNESERIFANLRGSDDWSLFALIDTAGHVVATSDAQQLPLASRVEPVLDEACRVIRFGGREYLAVTRATAGYQGYGGPGWLGHVMVPLEHAFADTAEGSDAGRLAQLDRALIDAVMHSPALFSAELRGIPQQAERIQRELNRSVWNGRVLQSREDNNNATFSKVLLSEIGRTGLQTSDVFAQSIANLHETVVSAVLGDSEFFAALAIDIMDRNLYERANDCRWWALTHQFAECLASDPRSSATREQITATLKLINSLYTVYDNLVVFDRHGLAVAVSNANYAGVVGQAIGEEWVGRTLALCQPQQYVVSAFAATPLYSGRHTYIYAAPVFAPGSNSVVGGIGIVFDAAPQFAAMLADALPARPPSATAVGGPQGFAAFVERNGRVVACSDGAFPPGSTLALDGKLLQQAAGQRSASIVALDGQYYAVGSCPSTGYREYKAAEDAYRNELIALVLIPLGAVQAAAQTARHDRVRSTAQRPLERTEEVAQVATFQIGGEWLGVPCDEVVEAVDATHITPLPGMPAAVRGVVMRNGSPVPVFDLKEQLRFGRSVDETDYRQVVIMRGRDGVQFGVLAHALADTLEIPLRQIDAIGGLFPGQMPLAESVVRPDPAQGREGILIVLSVERIRDRVMGRAPELLSTWNAPLLPERNGERIVAGLPGAAPLRLMGEGV